jgi:hypothetical protein
MVRRRNAHSSDDDFSADDYEEFQEKRLANRKKKAKMEKQKLTAQEKEQLDSFYSQEQSIDASAIRTFPFFRFYPNTASTLVNELAKEDLEWMFLCVSPTTTTASRMGSIPNEFKSNGPYLLTALTFCVSVFDFTNLPPYPVKILDPFTITQGCTAAEAEKAFIDQDPYFRSLPTSIPPGYRHGSKGGVITNLRMFSKSFRIDAVLTGPKGEEVFKGYYPSFLYGIPAEGVKIVPKDNNVSVFLSCKKLLETSGTTLQGLGKQLTISYEKYVIEPSNFNTSAFSPKPSGTASRNLDGKNSQVLDWMLNQESSNVDHFVSRLDSHLILKFDDQLVDFIDGTVTRSISAYWKEPLAFIHGGIVFGSSRKTKIDIFLELVLENPLKDFSNLAMVQVQKKYMIPSKATFIHVQEMDIVAWEMSLEALKSKNPSLSICIIEPDTKNTTIADIIFADVVLYMGRAGYTPNHSLFNLRSDIPTSKLPVLASDHGHVKAIIDGIPGTLKTKLDKITVESFYYHRVIYDTKDRCYNNLCLGADWKWTCGEEEDDMSFVDSMLNTRSNLFERIAVIDKFSISL